MAKGDLFPVALERDVDIIRDRIGKHTDFGKNSLFSEINELYCDLNTIDDSAYDIFKGRSWDAICYGGGRYVALSKNGNNLMYSPDGFNWAPGVVDLDLVIEWTDICYGNSLFVAVASNLDVITTSTNGINWTVTSIPIHKYWTSVCYGNGLFVAVASGGSSKIMISSNGKQWALKQSPGDTAWKSICFGNSLFVAVGDTGSVRTMTSSDGNNWTLRGVSSTPPITWQSICYGDGQFVAVANCEGKNVMTSVDGINWNHEDHGTIQWEKICYGSSNNWFIAIRNIKNFGYVLSAGDAVGDWFDLTEPTMKGWNALCYGDNGFVIVGERVPLVIDSDELTFSSFNDKQYFQSNIPEFSSPWGIDYCNGLFIALTSTVGFYAAISLDGETWTNTELVKNTNDSITWNSVCYGNGIFVAVGDSRVGTIVANSKDGVNWNIGTCPKGSWKSVCYANSIFVVIGNSIAMTSVDGINWTQRTTPFGDWKSLCFGNGLFVAVSQGNGNNIITSPNGINWTDRAALENNSWESVCYGNGLFVAVASSGVKRITTSFDGISWISRKAPENNEWRSVCYGDGLFVAVSNNGVNRIMVSIDGIDWEPIYTPSNIHAKYICYGKGKFVIFGPDGVFNTLVIKKKSGTLQDIDLYLGEPSDTLPHSVFGQLNIIEKKLRAKLP